MALVRRFSEATKERQSIHGEVECAYSILSDIQGRKFLQLETFGSSARKFLGKTSQSIQFDEASLRELRRIIDGILR
jgi:hypothetical protein